MVPKPKALDLQFDDLGDLSTREYDLLRIGLLTLMLSMDEDDEFPDVTLPGIIRQAFRNELAYRTRRVKG